MPNTHIAYFGYGSLVNRATHRTDIVDFSRVSLKGWRRQWLSRPPGKFGHVALLSVIQDFDSEIDGLMVLDYARNLPALDEREIRYDRKSVDQINLKEMEQDTISKPRLNKDIKVNIYVAKEIAIINEPAKSRILRSYLDAVMQGYLNKFGREGLDRFLQSTDNFEIGIREDRNQPVYTRPVALPARERSLFDQLAPPGM